MNDLTFEGKALKKPCNLCDALKLLTLLVSNMKTLMPRNEIVLSMCQVKDGNHDITGYIGKYGKNISCDIECY